MLSTLTPKPTYELLPKSLGRIAVINYESDINPTRKIFDGKIYKRAG